MTDPAADTTERHPCDRFTWERIVRRAVLPKPVKFMALILATYADPDGAQVRPGAGTLAAVTGDSERNARRHVRTLDGLGLIDRVQRGGGRGGRGTTNTYRLTLPSDLLERVTLIDPSERGDNSSTGVDNSDEGGESPDTQMSSESGPPDENDRTSRVTYDGMTGHLASNDRTPRCPTTIPDHPPQKTIPDVTQPACLTTRATRPPSTRRNDEGEEVAA